MNKISNFKIIVFFFIIIFYNSSCTGLITSLSANNIKGGWNVKTFKDDKTSQITPININNINRILGNKIGDALYFNEDGTFEIFRQITGNSGTQAGIYEIDVTTLSLTFNNEKLLKRSISSLSETELIMRDTILGVAKTITYIR